MIRETISTVTAQRFYSWLGARHDLGARFEREAKQQALSLLHLQSGQCVLNLGCGTGAEQPTLRRAVGPTGTLHAVDLSPVMLCLTAERGAGTLTTQANAVRLPYADAMFDRILSTYLLDLLPAGLLPIVAAECARVLRPDGRLVLVTLTHGVDSASRAVVAAWRSMFRLHPLLLGGCRPVPLASLVAGAGLTLLDSTVVVQLGVPSAIVVVGRA